MARHFRPRSLTLSLFSTVILVLLAINSIAIISAKLLVSNAQDSILRELTYVQSLYVDQLDRELRAAQNRISLLCGTYSFSIAMNKEYQTGERQYEALRAQVELDTSMKSWLIQFPLLDGYFTYSSDCDVLIIRGDEVRAVQWIMQSIQDKGDTTGDASVFNALLNNQWALMDTPQGQMILFSAVRRDVSYGAWLQVSRLMSEWGLGSLQEEQSYAFYAMDSIPAGSKDSIYVLSSEAHCFFHRDIAASTLAIPQSISVLETLSILMLCLLPVVWFSLQHFVMHPLKELIKAIHQIEIGDTTYRIPERATSSEFAQLNRRFNQSIEQVAQSKMAIYEAQLDKEKTYVRYLAQQMQPHFVLNTLNLVYSMEPSQYDLMQETIRNLAQYFRYVAHVREQFVPLASELDHVRNYFFLQQTRYPGYFFFEINCPEALLQEKIPPLIIQTFAENTMKHALTIGEQNMVSIQIDQAEGGIIHIAIFDSGKGFPPHVLEQIRIYKQTKAPQPDLGIGIANTIERMQILYKGDANIQFCNGKSGGARIDVYLPVRSNTRGGV